MYNLFDMKWGKKLKFIVLDIIILLHFCFCYFHVLFIFFDINNIKNHTEIARYLLITENMILRDIKS